MDLAAYHTLKNACDARHVTLVAVSKTHPVEQIKLLYDAGHRDFGENKVQELTDKYEALPKDIRWHLIGHLQSNKVKYIAPFIHLVHSIDSLDLLKELDKQAARHNRVIDYLLQVHIAQEETKFGLSAEEVTDIMKPNILNAFTHTRLRGLMGMATNTEDEHIVKNEFAGLKNVFAEIAASMPGSDFKILSMGMSSDYDLAIDAGSTLVRVGSLIFGVREYNPSP
jgi:pyridoxal phosphate enzyme (YggS family)